MLFRSKDEMGPAQMPEPQQQSAPLKMDKPNQNFTEIGGKFDDAFGEMDSALKNRGTPPSQPPSQQKGGKFDDLDTALGQHKSQQQKTIDQSEAIKNKMMEKLNQAGIPEALKQRASDAYDRAVADGQPLNNLRGIANLMESGNEGSRSEEHTSELQSH